MKNNLIISALLTLAVVSAQAQGVVSFQNNSSTKVFTNAVAGGGAVAPTGPVGLNDVYYYALYCSTSATTVSGQSTPVVGSASLNYAFNDSNWQFVAYGSNFITSGQFTSAKGTLTVVTNIAAGSTAQFVVIGWSGIGPNISAVKNWFNGGNPVVNGWIGQSAVSGTITLGASGSPATLFGTSAPDIAGFTLGLVIPGAASSPIITTQPANETIPTGANVKFTVTATGYPAPAYQWMFDTNTVIPGAISNSYTVTDAQSTNAGTYSCVITNTAGTTNSVFASLTVNAPSGNGLIYLDNFNGASATKIYTNSAVGGPQTGLTVGTPVLYDYAFYASATATTVSGQSTPIVGAASSNYAFDDSNWTLVGYGFNITNRGQLMSSAGIAASSSLSGFPPGTTAQFVVIGWSTNVGTDITNVASWFNNGNPASNGWIGQSAVSGTIELGNGGTIATPTLFGASSPAIEGFTLGLASPNNNAVYTVPSASQPAILNTTISGGTITLSWPSGAGSWKVQSGPSASGPWNDLGTANGTNATSYLLITSAPAQGTYFRLVTN